MKTAAIIAEYNPFHNGHAYQLSEVRKRSDADFLIILMSGDFVQRGTPALFDKYVRAEAALKNGADLVLELPLAFATGSAQRFAEGAVSILSGLGIVDELWFGSEEGNLARFEQLAGILSDEPSAYQDLLKQALRKGLSYPAARSLALSEYSRAISIEAFLKEPNNILGLEYILALKKHRCPIQPRTLQRTGSGYHTDQMEGFFSSATAIRSQLLSGNLSTVRTTVPEKCYSLYEEKILRKSFVGPDQISEALQYQLWKESRESLCRILDINEDLANRIIHLRPDFRSFESYAELLQTRNQTRVAMQRALLHILLGITWEDAEIHFSGQRLVRMLGMSDTARKGKLLSGIDKKGPIVVTANPGTHILKDQYAKDLFASEYYQTVGCRNSGEPFIQEFSRKLIVV